MTELEDMLSQINENPRLLAKIDITEETDAFDRERMREIITGLNNEKLIDAFIRLTVNKWNSLEARHDSRLYQNTPFDKSLKFTGEEYYDPQGNRLEDSIDSYLDTAKTEELHARELEAKEMEDQKEILRELGLLGDEDFDEDQIDDSGDSNQSHKLEIVGKKLNRIADLFSAAQDKEDELLESRRLMSEQLKEMVNLHQMLSAEIAQLTTENAQLKSENMALQSEVNILRAEHAQATQTQQERDAALLRAEELNKALENTKEQLGRRSVTLQSLVKGIQETPYESMKLKCLEALNHLLAGNKHWVEFRDDLNKKEMEKKKESTIIAENYYADGSTHEDHSHHIGLNNSQAQPTMIE